LLGGNENTEVHTLCCGIIYYADQNI
jgi:hypothetical protein